MFVEQGSNVEGGGCSSCKMSLMRKGGCRVDGWVVDGIQASLDRGVTICLSVENKQSKDYY